MADINDTISTLATGFEELKSTLNTRMAEVESKGAADPLIEEKLNRLTTDLAKAQSDITDFAKKANRPTVSEADADRDAHRDAFYKWARKGVEGNLSELEAKAMSVGSDSDGGYAIPETLSTSISERVVQLNPMRSLATVIQTSSENFKTLHNVKGTASAWVGETDARGVTASPKFVEIQPFFGEVYANIAVTQKLLDDAFFDVEGFLAKESAQEFARAEGKAFVDGDGVNKPKGLLAGPTAATADKDRVFGTIQHIASGAAAALPSNVETYYKVMYALKSQHRVGASWQANSSVLCSLMSKTDTDGRPLWQPSLVLGQPSSFIGAPIYENQDFADVAANALPLTYGNYASAYMIADRVGIRTLRDPYTNKPFVMFYSTKRVGGVLLDSEAVKVLKIATA